MTHEATELQAFVKDYERDFGVEMPDEDADRILIRLEKTAKFAVCA